MKRSKNISSMLLAALLMIAGVSIALAQSSASYDLTQSILSGGGDNSASSNYDLDAAVGQPAAKTSTSSSYSLTNGLFSGAVSSSPEVETHDTYLPILIK